MQRLPATLGAILVEQSILDHLKLKLTDGTDDASAVELIDKELCYTFAHELVGTLDELLLLHRVGILDIFEVLRTKARQPLEVEHFA